MKKYDIVHIIKDIGKKENLFGGNCGTFAIAMCKKFPNSYIVLCCKHKYDSEDEYFDDLEYGEPDIFHVAFKIDGTLYDGSGIIDYDYLEKFCETYYHSFTSRFDSFKYILPLDEIIENNTNWDTSINEFSKLISNSIKNLKEKSSKTDKENMF